MAVAPLLTRVSPAQRSLRTDWSGAAGVLANHSFNERNDIYGDEVARRELDAFYWCPKVFAPAPAPVLAACALSLPAVLC